jgi:hypothetical protein
MKGRKQCEGGAMTQRRSKVMIMVSYWEIGGIFGDSGRSGHV